MLYNYLIYEVIAFLKEHDFIIMNNKLDLDSPNYLLFDYIKKKVFIQA